MDKKTQDRFDGSGTRFNVGHSRLIGALGNAVFALYGEENPPGETSVGEVVDKLNELAEKKRKGY